MGCTSACPCAEGKRSGTCGDSFWVEQIGPHDLGLIRSRLAMFLTDLNGGTLPPPAPLK